MSYYEPSDFRPEDYMPAPPAPHTMLQDDEPGPKQPHLGYTLVLLLVGFIAILLATTAVMAVGAWLHLLPHSVAAATRGYPKTSILIEGLGFGIALGFAVLVFPRFWHRTFSSVIQWNAQTARVFAARLIGAGVVLSVAAQLIESRLNLQKEMPVDEFFRHPADVWVVALFGTLVAPACEEIFFRGFLLRGLAIAWDWMTTPKTEEARIAWQSSQALSRNGLIVGGVISSGLFAAMHAAQLGFAWNAVGVLWLVGGALTFIRIRLNSVAASTLVHATYNGLLFALLFVMTDGFRHLDKVNTH